MNYLIPLIISLVIATFFVSYLIKDMNNIKESKLTSSYIEENSFRVLGSRDDYLYKTISKTRINNTNNNSSGNASRPSVGHGGARGGRVGGPPPRRRK